MNGPDTITEPKHERQELPARKPIATIVISGLIAAVFVAEMTGGGPNYVPAVVRAGAHYAGTLLNLELWRLCSSAFVHLGFAHVFFNLMVVWRLGSFLERILGTARFLCLYLGAGLAASLLNLASGFHTVSAGASGCLWGLLVADFVLAYRPRGLLPPALLPRARKVARENLLLNVLVSILPGVAWLAHLGGGLMGLLLMGTGLLTRGLANSDHGSIPSRPRHNFFFRIPAVVLSLLFLGSIAWAIQVGRPWALRRPLRLEARPLGPTGFTMEVPDLLYSSRLVDRLLEGASRKQGPSFHFGDLTRDPFLIQIKLDYFDTIITTTNDLDAAFEAALPAWENAQPGPQLHTLGERRVFRNGSFPGAHQAFDDGKRILDRYVEVFPAAIVSIDFYVREHAPSDHTDYRNHLLSRFKQTSLDPEGRFKRAEFLLRYHEETFALQDLDRLADLDPKNGRVLNLAAWMRATSPSDTLRDGVRAVEAAQRAVDVATPDERPEFLDTLAAAFAENGDLEKAVRTQQEAIDLLVRRQDQASLLSPRRLTTGLRLRGYRQRLSLYQEGKPYHE